MNLWGHFVPIFQSILPMNETFATLMLSLLPGLTRPQALALLRYYGSAEAAFADNHSPSELWARLQQSREGYSEARARAEKELAFCEQHHIQVFPFTSDDYPLLLKSEELMDAPLQLFCCGKVPFPRRRVLSVVGTRHITEYGKDLCERILADLAHLVPDVTIVSGLAYGVDIHAHRAALANGLPTYAVLAHGLDCIYPSLHRDTAKEMVSQGGLLTEYFSGTVPDKGNFVRRNRIVAGIAEATLVIESADRGGALITATIASSYGREVMAVPGRVGDPYSAGCNQLIQRNQASLVTSAADLVKLLNWPTESAKAQPSEPQLFPLYTAEQERVVDVLAGNDGLSMDALALQTGFTVAQLADLLFDLEEMGSVKRMPGNRYRVKG